MGVSMRRWMVAAVAAMVALTALAPATMAQTNLIPAGLTAVPPTALSPNLAQNPGFEANSGGVPTATAAGPAGRYATAVRFEAGVLGQVRAQNPGFEANSGGVPTGWT